MQIGTTTCKMLANNEAAVTPGRPICKHLDLREAMLLFPEVEKLLLCRRRRPDGVLDQSSAVGPKRTSQHSGHFPPPDCMPHVAKVFLGLRRHISNHSCLVTDPPSPSSSPHILLVISARRKNSARLRTGRSLGPFSSRPHRTCFMGKLLTAIERMYVRLKCFGLRCLHCCC